jgi:tRNA-modifying protein YgfZ
MSSSSTSLGALLVSGADARTFLQGQLSADLDALSARQPLLASCNSAQGRVQAVLWLVERGDGIALILPASMQEQTLARLRKYVLRSKVTFNAPARFGVTLLDANELPAQASFAHASAHFEHEGTSYVRLRGHAQILALAADASPAADAAQLRWQLDEIRAGLPQVYPGTHEAFVAQMLNLDLLGGISFEKGCYTGQEIVARTHFRGSIKRRMFRFACACPPPPPGTRLLVGEQHAGEVVDAAPTDAGCELLAVISLSQKDAPLEIEGGNGARLTLLTLPYSVIPAEAGI